MTRLCICGAPLPMARANRFGVRMPQAYCGQCKVNYRSRRDHHYRSPIIVGPATCRGCGAFVWFDRIASRWIDGDRVIHTCPEDVDNPIDRAATVGDRKGGGLAPAAEGVPSLTTGTLNTGYTGRQSQARSVDRTGTSGVSRSRERDADQLLSHAKW